MKPEYLEIEFAMPFYELYFPDLYNDNNLPKNPFELLELSNHLNTEVDFDLLFEAYENDSNEGEIFIFHDQDSDERFICLDLLKDEYDQMNMITIGVRIRQSDYLETRRILEKLYFKSTTRSDWQEDYFNQTLYRKVNNFSRQYKQRVTQKSITEFKESIRLKRHFKSGKDVTKSI